jgi:hypothetical protein
LKTIFTFLKSLTKRAQKSRHLKVDILINKATGSDDPVNNIHNILKSSRFRDNCKYCGPDDIPITFRNHDRVLLISHPGNDIKGFRVEDKSIQASRYFDNHPIFLFAHTCNGRSVIQYSNLTYDTLSYVDKVWHCYGQNSSLLKEWVSFFEGLIEIIGTTSLDNIEDNIRDYLEDQMVYYYSKGDEWSGALSKCISSYHQFLSA